MSSALLSLGACGESATDVYVPSSSVLVDSIEVALGEPLRLDDPSRVFFRSVYVNRSRGTVELTAGEQCWDIDVIRATSDTSAVWSSWAWLKQQGGVCEASLNVYRLTPGDSAEASFAVRVLDVLGDSLPPGPYAIRLQGSLGFNEPRGPFRPFLLTSQAITFEP